MSSSFTSKTWRSQGLSRKLKKASRMWALRGLPMGIKSLEEYIVSATINPLPKIRYTERPDVAAAHLLEGHVAIIVDTHPRGRLGPGHRLAFYPARGGVFPAPGRRDLSSLGADPGMVLSFIVTPLAGPWSWTKTSCPRLCTSWDRRARPPFPSLPSLSFWSSALTLCGWLLFTHPTPWPLPWYCGRHPPWRLFAVKVGAVQRRDDPLIRPLAAIGTLATPSLEFGLAIRLFRLMTLLLTGFFGLIGLAASSGHPPLFRFHPLFRHTLFFGLSSPSISRP